MNNNIDEVLLHDEYNSYKMNPDKRKKNTLNNNRCITECQFAGRTIYHPYNSVKITEHEGPFCATEGWFDTKVQKIKHHDLCNFSEGDLLAWADLDTARFIPYTQQKCELLLSSMHNIHNIKDAINWSMHTLHNDETRKRILNCAWKVYNLEDEDSKKYPDDLTIKYQKLALENWFDYIYAGLNSSFPKDLSTTDVKKQIQKILEDTNLIKMLLSTFRKINKFDWLILDFYQEDIKRHFINEIKTIL